MVMKSSVCVAYRDIKPPLCSRRTMSSPAGTITPLGESLASSFCGSEGGLTPLAISPSGEGGFEGGFLSSRGPAVIQDHIRSRDPLPCMSQYVLLTNTPHACRVRTQQQHDHRSPVLSSRQSPVGGSWSLANILLSSSDKYFYFLEFCTDQRARYCEHQHVDARRLILN